VGETMAVIMVAGNAVQMPHSPLDPVRTLTSNIALEMGYASGEHREALFATGILLFAIIMLLNMVANLVRAREKRPVARAAPALTAADLAAARAGRGGPVP
jgi:ABC-type phosphate transport system permease subunit